VLKHLSSYSITNFGWHYNEANSGRFDYQDWVYDLKIGANANFTSQSLCIILAGPFDCQKVRHPATQLLPIRCQQKYDNFASQNLKYLSAFILYFWRVSSHI
jgi:hypothetical protein